jgi:hypothetical protein
MSGDPENEVESWFRPTWESDDEALDPPGSLRTRKQPVEPDYDHPLLAPLTRAESALARLEAKVEAASDVVAEGLRARLSYLEAAGWLRHAHAAIHPLDLALREYGGVTSYGAAARSGQMASVLPATMADGGDFGEVEPAAMLGLDIAANRALALARVWRRLAELRTWRPLADAEEVCRVLKLLGYGAPDKAIVEGWLAGFICASVARP